jgi:hypothetical protein
MQGGFIVAGARYYSIGGRGWPPRPKKKKKRVKPDRQYYPNGRASLMNLIEAIIAVPDHRHPRGIDFESAAFL